MKLITEIYTEPLSILSESDKNGGKNVYIQGPFAVAGVKNRNGRVYPSELMERVVDQYKNDYIKTNRALGELGHPCFKQGANVFVENKGLIPIENVVVGDYVYGTTKDNKSIPTLVTATTKNKFNGNLIKFQSRSFKAEVTPYHRFYVKNRNGKFDVVTAQEIKDDIDSGASTLSHSYIPRTMENWVGVDEEFVYLSKTTDRVSGKHSYKYAENPLEIKLKDFCAFMGIFLSEGSVGYSTRKDGVKLPGEVSIHQNLGTNFDLILDLVSRIGFNKVTVRVTGNTSGAVVISDARLSDYLHKFGNCYEKFIPNEILESTKENIIEFLDWYHLGDGTVSYTKINNKEYPTSNVFTVSEKLADGLIECIIKSGYSTIKKIQTSKEDYIFAGREIKIENKSPLYRMTIGNSVGKYIDGRFTTVSEVPHDDYVYCLVTETENFFVEQNGSVFLSGNCRMSIDYERSTHIITEMVNDGTGVYIGKAKVLKTPMGKIIEGLLESGVSIGVSTRGAGSIQESNGTKVVGNDFTMVAVDVVSDPSALLSGNGGGAFVKGILEGVSFSMNDHGVFVQEEITKEVKKSYDDKKLTESHKLELFQKFISHISGK